VHKLSVVANVGSVFPNHSLILRCFNKLGPTTTSVHQHHYDGLQATDILGMAMHQRCKTTCTLTFRSGVHCSDNDQEWFL